MAHRIYGNMARRASFKVDAPSFPLPPHRLNRLRLCSKREEGQTCPTALFLGFATECRNGEEDPAADGEARDLQEPVDGHRRGLLHLSAARL